jgi:exosortase/archaeosortase family protein
VRPLQAVLIVAAFGPILLEWANFTGSVTRINYCLLVPVLAMVLAGTALHSWDSIPSPTPSSRRLGYLSLLLGGFLLFAGSLASIFTIAVAGFPFAVVGWIGIHWGTAGLLHLRYSLAMLFAMVPIPLPLLDKLTPSMVKASGAVSVALVYPFDMGATWIGSNLTYRGWTLFVAEACSGSGTLLVFGTLTLFMAGLFRLGPKAIFLTLALVAPFTLFINGLRIAVMAWVIDGFGPEVVIGPGHEILGQVVVLAGAILLATVVDRFSRRSGRKPEQPKVEDLA